MLRTLLSRRTRICPVAKVIQRTIVSRAHRVGPTEPPLLEQTVGEHFASIVSQYGDRDAVISRHQSKILTYHELDRDSDGLARGLVKKGIKKGDRVGVFLGNNIEFATVTYALFKLGAILVPLNPAFNAMQLISALKHLEATSLIIGTETNLSRKKPRSNVPLLQQLIPDLEASSLQSELVPSLRSVIIVDNSSGRVNHSTFQSTLTYEDVAEDGGTHGSLPVATLSPHDIVNIQFTSGTTSLPKAACLTHRNILNNGKSIGDRMLLTEKDIVCCPPPLFHCFGCILGYMATATHGSTIVFPAESFNALETLHSIRDYRCTALYGVPTMFSAEFALLEDGTVPATGFQHLRTGIAAGSSVPAEMMRKLHKVLNLTELTICYGMTETSPVSFMTGTDDPMEKRVDSVGRLLPHVEAKIVDPSNREKILQVGEKGELVVRGYLLMKGYWGDEARTREVLCPDEEGKMWMHTGDEAIMDASGYVRITGRIKDLIIRGGENIHPLEIENILLSHPRVAEVSVVGLPDERYGEVVAAFVVRRENGGGKKGDGGKRAQGAEELKASDVRDWVREKLSHHLVPKYVFWVDGYPKTPSGKIQKFKLREEGMKLLVEGKGVK